MKLRINRRKKGISPLIATVLLIAFTVAVAAIVSTWITTFTSESAGTVGEKSEEELYCVYGGVSLTGLRYHSTDGYLSGIVENTRYVDIGNITLQIFYDNATSKRVKLNNSGSTSFMSLEPREQDMFNLSGIDSNYNTFHLYTNCSNVYDDATKSDVTSVS
jgi:flagellin-like protein